MALIRIFIITSNLKGYLLKEKAEDAIREETERGSYRIKGTFRRRDQQTRFDEVYRVLIMRNI